MWQNQASHCEFDGKLKETEAPTWPEFPNGGKAIVEQILVSEERNKSKRAGLRVTVRDPSKKVNHLSEVISFTRSISYQFATITSLSELYIQEIYSDFYELWQKYKQQKTIEMSEAWPDTYDEGYQFQLKPNHKIH